MKKPPYKIALLFGSQSGKTALLAKSLYQNILDRNLPCDLYDLEGKVLEDFKDYEVIILATSTYGDGEPPDNATQFFQSLKGSNPLSLGEKKYYALIGIGDRFYPHFCQAAVDFDQEFKDRGFQAISETFLGEFQEQELIEDWTSNLLYHLDFIVLNQTSGLE